jgi:hypothetical protein
MRAAAYCARGVHRWRGGLRRASARAGPAAAPAGRGARRDGPPRPPHRTGRLGKTRLTEELATRADDLPVAWGAAVDDAGMPPLWPWERALRDLPGPREALTRTSRTGPGAADEVAAAEFVAQASTAP